MKREKLNSIIVPRWFDRHLHVRDGRMLWVVLPSTVDQRATGAAVMPNLTDPITTVERAIAYRQRIMAHLPEDSDFSPRMTCYLTDDTSPEEVVEGFRMRAWCAVKMYLADQNGQGGTTGSQHGVKNLLGRYRVFEAMEKEGVPLLGHFEAVEPEVDEFDREIVSVDRDLLPLMKSFPGLPIVLEHITDGLAADIVAEADHPIYATVTAHHLMISRNAMFSGGMNPGHYCKPVPKRELHRLKVRKYVTSGNRRFGAGTDSAPHDEVAKSRCYGCAAGIFTAPAAVEMYTTVFDEDDALEHLGPFLAENFIGLYGMETSKETMTIERAPLAIPGKVGVVQVFKGGTTLPWRLVG